tara:strand:- start:1991 stop:2647 length:657 start_codon:yes stop_codon:yes gene_type:complete
MKKRTVIALVLFLLLTTINPQNKVSISKFNLKEVIIENNFLIKEKDINNLLKPIYEKNLILLSSSEIENMLTQNDLIEGFKIKKIYPNKIKIKIFEKRPIAILINKKKKFYLSEKIDLINFNSLKTNEKFPYIFGSKEKFKKLYNDLNKIRFPTEIINKYVFYETDRWDLETINGKIIRLPSSEYLKSLKNYLEIKEKNDFIKYNVFDYRIDNQLILK